MFTPTLHLLNMIAKAFDENRLGDLAQHHVFPIPVYAYNDLLVFGSPETMVEALTIYRDIATEAGIVRVVPRIVAEGMPANQRASLWVEWDHFDQYGICQRTSQIHYVLRFSENRDTPLVELVEYMVSAFPEMTAHLPLSRTG